MGSLLETDKTIIGFYLPTVSRAFVFYLVKE